MWYFQKKCDNIISTIFWKSHNISKTIYRQTICRGLLLTQALSFDRLSQNLIATIQHFGIDYDSWCLHHQGWIKGSLSVLFRTDNFRTQIGSRQFRKSYLWCTVMDQTDVYKYMLKSFHISQFLMVILRNYRQNYRYQNYLEIYRKIIIEKKGLISHPYSLLAYLHSFWRTFYSSKKMWWTVYQEWQISCKHLSSPTFCSLQLPKFSPAWIFKATFIKKLIHFCGFWVGNAGLISVSNMNHICG